MPAPHPPHVTIYPSDRALAKALAERIAHAVSMTPQLVLGLPTGRTPVPFYEELAALAVAQGVDFSRATTFNLADEFAGVPAENPRSYRRFMQDHLFDHVNVATEGINFLNGATADAGQECERFEQAIAAAGGIDVLIVGVGTNGHIGFNEPAAELVARTHTVSLAEETRRSNIALFDGDLAAVPQHALSMGMGTILQARSIVLLATGQSKAAVVGRLVNGPITTELPASFLQLHPDVSILLDAAAASALSGRSTE